MARISTYEIDTVIHDDDNVIGTDPSSNNATRLFPVSRLSAFINEENARTWPSPVTTGTRAADAAQERMAAMVNFSGSTTSTDPNVNTNLPIVRAAADGTLEVAREMTLPVFRYAHNLGTRNISVTAYEMLAQNTEAGGASEAADGSIMTNILPTEIDLDRVVVIDENTVLVDFGEFRTINAFVVIMG